jgi:hypothetical protein
MEMPESLGRIIGPQGGTTMTAMTATTAYGLGYIGVVRPRIWSFGDERIDRSLVRAPE